MILVDNAVEMAIKTFLGLPKRITGVSIPRARLQEISESFPKLLKALEEHPSSRLDGIDLGEIEWFHRLRNKLYHEGNGITVERTKVEIYSQLARLLIARLYEDDIKIAVSANPGRFGEFILRWSAMERRIRDLVLAELPTLNGRESSFPRAIGLLRDWGVMPPSLYESVRPLTQIRARIVHADDKGADVQLLNEVEPRLTELESWLDVHEPKRG